MILKKHKQLFLGWFEEDLPGPHLHPFLADKNRKKQKVNKKGRKTLSKLIIKMWLGTKRSKNIK